MTSPVIDVCGLSTHFSTERGTARAVDSVDFSIAEGEILGVVGESGCGKSVTALSIMRLVPPSGRIVGGSILFDGKDLVRISESDMRRVRGNRISMIFQEPMTSLNPVLRIGEQIGEAIRLHRAVGRKEEQALTLDLLRKVGIPDPERRMKEHPHQLSGGMRQRVMIAMALACRPRLMIADEPTTALDVTIQAQIMDLMNHLREEIGTSILLITHDLGVIAEMAHRVIVMYAGRVVESAGVHQLFSTPQHPYTIGLIDSVPKIEEPVGVNRTLHAIPGIVPSLLDLPSGCSFRQRCGRAFAMCSEKDPVLLEVGPSHMARCWLYG